MNRAVVISFRLSPPEVAALDRRPGADRGEKLRALIHQAALADEIRAAVRMEMGAARREMLQTMPASDGTQTTGDVAVVRAGLAAVIEHSLLPAAPSDRKPGLLVALKSLKGA